ncbi:hypothetical protein MLD38_038763 [Melastoma candidum]|uniref:Uncharacterized protein n=1 Tax=Melastoma candidum TaxID=119954 RepID=A0ACB9L0A6_9MYRT|nr:hypothetical protein MLD38_038763 [Melastoma candidum]
MVKVRMNTADVAAEVKCLRRLIGMRCSNVYDLSPKTYAFKLMNSSGVSESGESEKVLLLMESGVRLHTTAYVRDKSNTPSGFTLKLRKHIRTRRLEDVRQFGYDRIVLFQFGLGANANYIILELYAQGNIILTDADFMVMTLLRSHRDDDKGFAIMSRHRYPTEFSRVFVRTTPEKLQAAFSLTAEPDEQLIQVNGDEKTTSERNTQDSNNQKGPNRSGKNKDGTRSKQATLKTVLGESLGYGPGLSEHMILDAGLVPNLKLSQDGKFDNQTILSLMESVKKFEDWLEDVISGSRIPEGYILFQNKNQKEQHATGRPGSQVYDEFGPILLNQFKTREHIQFPSFDAALDEFYSKIESQRAEQQQKAKEDSAFQKLSKIRSDQENRVHMLKKEAEHCVKMAELIEYNLEDVDAAIVAVRVALANGMSWEDLARMVKEEKKAGNPVAGLIDKLNLERNCITLLLSNNLDEMDDDEKTLPVDKVEVDLALSAHANARHWYEQKKKHESKQEKTVTAHDKAFKAAERKTRLQLSQEKAVATITYMRKVHWFEKFNWFISSENYLVISGRDAQQNEIIVKRYMSKGDLYVHADLHGASSTVIKNHRPDQPIPPLTLNQTGCFTVCHSQAWDSKIVTSAWWVYPHQVSKTAPTGEYLTVGSFMIRGRKNFLPPHPLVMGFGLLFRLDESSLGSHLNERRVRGEEEVNAVFEEIGPSIEEEPDSESDKEETVENTLFGAHGNLDSQETLRRATERVSGLASSNSMLKGTRRDNHPPEGGVNPEVSDCKTEEDNPSSSSALVNSQLEDLMDRALGIGPVSASARSNGLRTSDMEKKIDKGKQNDGKGSIRDKPHISKAERRKLKKGLSNNDVGEVDADERSDNAKPNNGGNGQNIKPGGGKLTRGQRSKIKKIKEKYADQDEEERSIRMALLASAGNLPKEEPSKPNETSSKERLPLNGEDAQKICYKCKKSGHLSRDCPEHQGDNASQSSHTNGADEDGNDLPPKDALSEADKITMEEDDIHEIADEEKEKLNDVDYLTGNPLISDILLYAVPVCGPYSAVQSYKYRVKIIPGTLKKGKAAKTAMNLFSHIPEATSREKELMKACTDPELVAAIVGNARVTAAGLTQLKQKQKKAKKGAKKDS